MSVEASLSEQRAGEDGDKDEAKREEQEATRDEERGSTGNGDDNEKG
jgi:hypothetical protein